MSDHLKVSAGCQARQVLAPMSPKLCTTTWDSVVISHNKPEIVQN